MNKKIYISGAIDSFDPQSADCAEHRLRLMGYKPVNPYKIGLQERCVWRMHLKVIVGLITQCDHIYILKDRELGELAKLEYDIAKLCNINVIFEHEKSEEK